MKNDLVGVLVQSFSDHTFFTIFLKWDKNRWWISQHQLLLLISYYHLRDYLNYWTAGKEVWKEWKLIRSWWSSSSQWLDFITLSFATLLAIKNRSPKWFYSNFWSSLKKLFCISIKFRSLVKISWKSKEYSEITVTLKYREVKKGCRRFFEFCKFIKC